jgi:hypothetical protein
MSSSESRGLVCLYRILSEAKKVHHIQQVLSGDFLTCNELRRGQSVSRVSGVSNSSETCWGPFSMAAFLHTLGAEVLTALLFLSKQPWRREVLSPGKGYAALIYWSILER